MLAIETVLGALTGYFTNDIAIRQLFAKNGVVVRERAQFTEMVVQVLEEQIIDKETVEALRENPEMSMVFRRFVRELLTEELPYIMSDCALADIDKDGGLRDFLLERLSVLRLSDAKLDVERLHREVAALFDDAAFQQSLQEALQGLAALSLSGLGADRLLGQRLTVLANLDNDGLELLLSRWEARVQEAVSDFWHEEGGDAAVSLRDVFPFDGEKIAKALEQLLLNRQLAEQERWLNVLKEPAFQEHVYVLAERLLEEVIAVHLPSLAEAFAPLLIEDRALIEQMVLESVAECPEAGDFIREAVMSALRGRFAEEKDGKDWMSALLDEVMNEETFAATCHRLAQFLLSWVVKEIDQWRQVGVDSEEAVCVLRQRWVRWRGIGVRLLDRVLEQPLKKVVTLEMVQSVVRLIFAALRQELKPRALQRLQQELEDILRKPLSEWLLTTERQEKFLTWLPQYWKDQGPALTASIAPSGETLNDGAKRLIDWLYQQPLSRLMCSSKEAVPFETIADALKNVTFSELRPFLGQMTKEQLDALSHHDIRELTLDMIGREMRPLAYLGGGVGAVVGVATGAAMEMSGVTPDPDQLMALTAARVGMYGVVGYGTNVAAVTGLFRPYRKIGPIQGLMSKNQSRFAQKMKEMAESYIINEDIWSAQIERFSNHIDDNFDALLHRGVHLLTKSENEQWRQLLQEMVQNQSGVWLHVALNRKRVEKIAASVRKRVDLTAAAGSQAAYHHLGQKAIERLAMFEAANGKLSQALLKRLQAVSSENWMRHGNAVLKTLSLPKESGAYERFWQQYGLPEYRMLPERLLAHSEDLAFVIDQVLQPRLSFALQLGYHMAGGRRLVQAILEIFCGKKLPSYLFNREASVSKAALLWLQQNLAGCSMSEMGISFSQAEGEWLQSMCASLSGEELQTLLLNGFRWCEFLSYEQERCAFVGLGRFLDSQWQVLFAVPRDVSERRIWQAVEWERILNRLHPVLATFGVELAGFRDYDGLLSFSEGHFAQAFQNMVQMDARDDEICSGIAAQLWKMVSPACMAYMTLEGRRLLMFVDVPGLVEERINALSPKLLEQLMRGIAQPYFKRVERMGWLGAVVALPATAISRMLGGF